MAADANLKYSGRYKRFFVVSDIDMDGDYIVVGSRGFADVYKLNGSSWDLDTSLPASAGGNSVAISGDSIVTGSGNNRGGSVSFYQKEVSSGSWQHNSTITAPDIFPFDNVNSDILFGAHVAIDGSRALVTSLSSFDRNTTSPIPNIVGLSNVGHFIVKVNDVWQYQQAVQVGAGIGTLENRLGPIGITIDGDQAIINGLVNIPGSIQSMFVYDLSIPQPPTSLRCDFAFSPFTGSSQLDLFWENNDNTGIDGYEVELITKDLAPPQDTTVNTYAVHSGQLSQNIPIMSSIELPTQWKVRVVAGAIGDWSQTINLSDCTTTIIF